MKYFRFMEFQARGAPHFDIFISSMVPFKTYVSPSFCGIELWIARIRLIKIMELI